jgi:hypothetical protein
MKTFKILLELMEEVEAETEEEACKVFIEKVKSGDIELYPIAWEDPITEDTITHSQEYLDKHFQEFKERTTK